MGQGVQYKIDITFVIDATGSMEPIMSQVKQKALVMHEDIINGLRAANKEVSELRIRVVDFADFASEGDDAIHQSNFFSLPAQKAEFERVVQNIQYENLGGDVPENGLEALYIAMNSDWVSLGGGQKGRHIIVVITDAPPLHLQERAGSIGYEADEYPADIAELESIWSERDGQDKMTKLSYRNKRLILFVPEGEVAGHSWADVEGWEYTTTQHIEPGTGLEGVSFDAIVQEIVRSAD